jgi:SAM-dependent methyltransferase
MAQPTLKARVRQHLPMSVLNTRLLTRSIIDLIRPEQHECNLCGYAGRFWPFGNPPRRGAACGRCRSLERHRLVALWTQANSDTIEGARVLHFAPEPTLRQLFQPRASKYQSADLDPTAADTVLNIESINLADESFDIVICSHVLEHVNDEKALNEIHRILAPGGHAMLMFPIVEGWDQTYENPEHTSPDERTTYYGQADHVRMYGRDVRDRIKGAGFTLTEFTAKEPDVSHYGLVRGDKIFIATKPESAV